MKSLKRNRYNRLGKPEGYWEKYYSNGNIMYKGSYKDGKPEGYWEFYWDNGNIYLKGNYKEGMREGIWEEYYDNGKIYSRVEVNYLNKDI